METVRKINDELAIAGQITSAQLQQIVQDGFKSVLNLRSPDEDGFLSDEQQQAEALGLCYVNAPVHIRTITPETAAQVLAQVDQISKPTLIHCSSAMRAATIALMHIATCQGATLKQALQQAENLGLLETLASTY